LAALAPSTAATLGQCHLQFASPFPEAQFQGRCAGEFLLHRFAMPLSFPMSLAYVHYTKEKQ
jgi:hypothetical protein